MISAKMFLLLAIPLACSSCVLFGPSAAVGSHKMAVAWRPGYEYVPDCNDLIEKSSTSTDVKGPNVTTSFGVTVGGGEYNRTVTPLGVTDSLQAANLKYRQLCSLLPSYANGDKEAFYKARNDMFELIKGSQNVATAVATQTGQSPPASLPTVPTAATEAAKTAGVDPSKGVSNPSPTSAQPPARQKTAPSSQGTTGKGQVRSAVTRLKHIAKKPVPNKTTRTATPPNRPG
jgi:hypothetical protein